MKNVVVNLLSGIVAGYFLIAVIIANVMDISEGGGLIGSANKQETSFTYKLVQGFLWPLELYNRLFVDVSLEEFFESIPDVVPTSCDEFHENSLYLDCSIAKEQHITLKRSISIRVASFFKGIEKACSYKLTADSEKWVSKIMSSLNSNEQEAYDILKLIPGQLALRDPIKFCKTIKTDRTSKNYFEFK